MDNRSRIIEEAAKLFRAYGIRAVTMDMLSANLGISKRTLYEIFSDKDELLHGVIGWMTEKKKELMDHIMQNSENVIEAIFKLIAIMSDHYREMSPAFKMDIRKFYSHVINNPLKINEQHNQKNSEEIIRRGIQEGLFRDDIDIEITNRCLLEFSKIKQEDDIVSEDSLMDEKVMRNIFINYLRGISTLKGLELINYYESRY